MNGLLFLVSAPSGAGKTTIVNEVLKEIGTQCLIKKVVTYTTRPIRIGEVDGVDYFFIKENDFLKKIKNHFFLEWSTWYGSYYGFPQTILNDLKNGISYIAIVDRFGARKIKELYKDAILIWIEPENIEVLKQRLIFRGTDNEDEIKKRLEKAAIEIDEEKKEKLYEIHIINDEFHSTVKKVINFIVGEILEK